jgi:methyl-accepting chemotaxis protein
MSSALQNVSLRTKLVALIAILFSGVAIFLSAFFPNRMETLARGWAERRAVGMAVVLASGVTPGFEFDDATNVSGQLEGLAAAPEVLYAAVHRADGTILASFHPERMPELRPFAVAKPEVTIDGDSLQVVAPVTPRVGPPGTLLVGMSLAELELEKRANRIIVGAVSAGLFSLGLVVAFLGAGYFVRPIRRMTAAALRIADGDLARMRIGERGGDEVGQMARAFERMLGSQRQMVRQIATTSQKLADAAQEMQAGTQNQEEAITRQSVAVEDASRSVEALSTSAAHIAESARGVLRDAERTGETNQLMAQKAVELNAHAGRIEEILEVIREIADRSDLLALNASIESTRAGEAGRSFALVAQEMRRLAERVTASVQDVRVLVDDVKSSGASSVMATEEAKRLAESTTLGARQITSITEDQSAGTETVSRSMREITTVIQESVDATQKTAAVAEELKTQADRLSEAIGRYHLGDDE